MTRVIPMDGLKFPLIPLSLSLPTAILIFSFVARQHIRQIFISTVPPKQHESDSVDFSGFALTEREQEAVAGLLAGRTSHETAESLGLKASTVREYLRRAYRKLNVHDASQLLSLYGHATQSKAVVDFNNELYSLCRYRKVMFSIGILNLLPLHVPFGIWAGGQDRLLAIGIGVFCASLIRLKSSKSIYVTTITPFFLISLISGSWVIVFDSILPKPFLAIAFLSRVALAYYFAICFIEAQQRNEIRMPSSRQLAPCIPLLFLCFFVPEPLINLLQAITITSFSLWVYPKQKTVRQATLNNSTKTPGNAPIELRSILFGMIFGLVIEELWRGFYWFSFMPAAITFILAVGTTANYALVYNKLISRDKLILFTILLFSNSLLNTSVIPATLLVWTCGALLILISYYQQLLSPPYILLGIGLGLFYGCIALNMLANIFTYHTSSLILIGSQNTLDVIAIFLSTMLFTATGCYCGRYIIKMIRAYRPGNDNHSSSDDHDAAIDVLKSHGLSDPQAQIALRLIQGQSVRDIARSMNYAPSTIRNARRICFQRMGVANIQQLHRELSAAMERSHNMVQDETL